MKAVLHIGGLACCLYVTTLFGDSSVEGPRLGYVGSPAGVRGVLGLVGASRVTAPIESRLQQAMVLPGSDFVAGIDEGGMLVRGNLRDGTSTSLGIQGVVSIHVSPGGAVILVRTSTGIVLLSDCGTKLATYDLPGAPLRVASADVGNTVALTIEDAQGEALYVISPQGAQRILSAPSIPAIAFAPGSRELLVAVSEGEIFRIQPDLQMAPIGKVPGIKALASTGHRAIAVAGSKIHVVPIDGSPESVLTCPCDGAIAQPLGGLRFLLSNTGSGPMWLLDASSDEVRVAFIPGAVDE